MSLLLLFGGGGAAAPAPTYATWSNTDKSSDISLSLDLLTATQTATAWRSVRADTFLSTGKWQVEFVYDGGNPFPNIIIGVSSASLSVSSFLGSDTNGRGFLLDLGRDVYGGSAGGDTSTPLPGTYITAYFDLDAKTMGVMYDGVDVKTGLSIAAFTGSVAPTLSLYNSGCFATMNFGASPMQYPKAGYNQGWYV